MTTDRANDLAAFRNFIDERLAQGGSSLTPAQCLELWEIENTPDEERAATVQAVREALEEMRAGDIGVPAEAFLAELRHKYNLSPTP